MMRMENDFIGTVEVEDGAYYGSFTARAKQNFRFSRMKVHGRMIKAIIMIKRCAACANKELGCLDPSVADAIVRASDEALDGRFDSQFILDAFQAGAGTPLHMNVNEVLANRAEEILGGEKGEYRFVHPNNHLNMSQSSNDVVPSAMRMASIGLSGKLLQEAESLKDILLKKSREHRNSSKIGRTHLQDAVPMTYGLTFGAYSKAIEKDIEWIADSVNGMRPLGIGGTATGSGINTHPEFRKVIIRELNRTMNLELADDPVDMTANMNDVLSFSSSLKAYASTLNRIANDLRFYSSGPKAGISEITLPEVEPGSSIMPGKLNPSIPEAVNMMAFQVMANDLAVLLAGQSGQLELNFMTPLASHNILQSLELLTNGTVMFKECVMGLVVDKARSQANLDNAFGYATAFNPYLGYKQVSLLVTEAHDRDVKLKDLIIEKGLMEKEDIERVIKSAGGPSRIDQEIKKRVAKKTKN